MNVHNCKHTKTVAGLLCLSILLLFFAGCSKNSASASGSAAAKSSAKTFVVNKWGPKSTVAGVIPNKQSDGGMGVWISVSGKTSLGKYQVLFDGHPLAHTGGGVNLITASVPASLLSTIGAKTIALKEDKGGKVFKVGSFAVTAPQSKTPH